MVDDPDPDKNRVPVPLQRQGPEAAGHDMQMLDTDFVRVLEDLIDVLIENGTIRLTDLPIEAQQKLTQRKQARRRLRDTLDLMGDGDEII